MFTHRKQRTSPAQETTATEPEGKKRRRLPILLSVLAAGAAAVKLAKSRISRDQTDDGSAEADEPDAPGEVAPTTTSEPETTSAAEKVPASARTGASASSPSAAGGSAQQEARSGSNRSRS
jgi:hypothetical protein